MNSSLAISMNEYQVNILGAMIVASSLHWLLLLVCPVARISSGVSSELEVSVEQHILHE
jgi:hypothetical protein